MLGTNKRWKAGSRMAIALALAAFSVCVAHAQSGDVLRTGHFDCNGLGAVSASVTLTWSTGTEGGTWGCSGDANITFLTIQPGSADSWSLTITLSDTTTCTDGDPSIVPGKPVHIGSRCASASGPGAAHLRIGS